MSEKSIQPIKLKTLAKGQAASFPLTIHLQRLDGVPVLTTTGTVAVLRAVCGSRAEKGGGERTGVFDEQRVAPLVALAERPL